MLTVRAEADLPPPLTVSLTVKYPFFMTSLIDFDEVFFVKTPLIPGHADFKYHFFVPLPCLQGLLYSLETNEYLLIRNQIMRSQS